MEGSWLEYVEFNGKRYWDLEKIDPATLIKINEPLPSDCRFREDLLFLAKKDLTRAQEYFFFKKKIYILVFLKFNSKKSHKIRLEVLQRADRKLRQDNANARKKNQHRR